MDGSTAVQSSVEQLVQMTGDMRTVVTLQLIAAILMIGVEVCLMVAIITLVRHTRKLSWDLALMIDNMGWSQGEHADRMAKTQRFVEEQAEHAEPDEAVRLALLEAETRTKNDADTHRAASTTEATAKERT